MQSIASFLRHIGFTIHVTPALGMLWLFRQGLLYLWPIPNTVNKLKYNFMEKKLTSLQIESFAIIYLRHVSKNYTLT